MLRVMTVALTLSLLALPSARAETPALVTFKVMSLEVALELAQATLASCRKSGYQVAVVVTDRFGNVQVALRDRFAGAHTVETARRKAWTAVSFRTDTLAMAEVSQAGKPQSGVRQVTGALMIGGGVPVQAGGTMVGGVGVSGAPGGEADDACGRDGIAAVTDKLEF